MILCRTEVASNNICRDSNIGYSGRSCSAHSMGIEESICCTSSCDTSNEGTSLVPKWKDDGYDSTCTSIEQHDEDDIDCSTGSHNFHRIPSTVEFTLPGKNENEPEGKTPHITSSIRYPKHFAQVQCLEIMMDDFPSTHLSTLSSTTRLQKNHSVTDDYVDTDVKCNERRSSFRRRLHIGMNIRSELSNSLLQSQSSPLSLSLPSSAQPRWAIFGTTRPRFVLMFVAIVLVMLSIHDDIRNSRQYYKQQYHQISADVNNRREEIALPLIHVQVDSDTGGTAFGERDKGQENTKVWNQLPKFFFPRVDHQRTNWIRGSNSTGRSGGNLMLGRPQKPRPLFAPDTRLPSGGYQKPLKIFVFDPQNGEQEEGERRLPDNHLMSSWTSWITSLTLVGMLFDIGWKEYRRFRTATILSSRDE